MILSFIALISLVPGKYSSNLINEDLIQVLRDNRQPTTLTFNETGNIEHNINQTLEIQNNMFFNEEQTQPINIELDSLAVGTNIEHNDLFINQYSDFVANYQSLNNHIIQCLNDIYNQYLNNPNGLQENMSYLLQLNQIYEQYLTDALNQYLVAIANQEIINVIDNIDDGSGVPDLAPVVQIYYNLLENQFLNSVDGQYLNHIYTQYSNEFYNNHQMHVMDYLNLNENNNQD